MSFHVHYRILFPHVIPQMKQNAIRTYYAMGLARSQARGMTHNVWIGHDHMHVITASLSKAEHRILRDKLRFTAGLVIEELGWEKDSIVVESRTFPNRDLGMHDFMVDNHELFHAQNDGHNRSWNTPAEDLMFDSCSMWREE